MKIKSATIISVILISTNAQAEDAFNDYNAFEKNIASAGKIAPKDFDSLYRIPISASESFELDGNVGFQKNADISQEQEATLRINYSLNF